jgi:hypothetical protein
MNPFIVNSTKKMTIGIRTDRIVRDPAAGFATDNGNELDPAGFQIAQGLIDGNGFTGDVSRDGTQQIRLDAMRLQSLQRITYPQI